MGKQETFKAITEFEKFFKQNEDLKKKFMAGKIWLHWDGEKVVYSESSALAAEPKTSKAN
jgi:hypothetical protein